MVLPGGQVSDVKGYGADVILDDLEVRGVSTVIPPNGGCKVQPIIDRHPCAPRNLVERGFNKLKHFRGVATRYDKNPDDCVAGGKFTSARIWMRFNGSMA